MSGKTISETQNTLTTVPGYQEERISSASAKGWQLVSTVLDWMQENKCYNYSAAFRALTSQQDGPWKITPHGMRQNFHRAMKLEYVQQRLADRYKALDLVVYTTIERQWITVIAKMLDIATGREGTARDAVTAARFLDDQKKDILDRLEAGEAEVGEHPALEALRNFQASRKKKVVARRITEEVTISDDPDANNVAETVIEPRENAG